MPAIVSTQNSNENELNHSIPTNYGALSVLISVFFFWGFIAAGNSVFIPFCKNYFKLDQFQSQLIDFAFYLAYYIGALALFVYSMRGGVDLVGKQGYKNSIISGLLMSAAGALVMIVAVNSDSYYGMLTGLFIVALGFSIQQTAAQPFAISLGNPATGTARINLGGGINSFGTAIGPIIVALALFGTTQAISDESIKQLSLDKVVVLYAGVGILFLMSAALFYFSKKVPSGKIENMAEKNYGALWGLLILTLGLIVCFIPVFNSYKINTEFFSPDDLKNLEWFRVKWLLIALLAIVVSILSFKTLSKKKPAAWGAMQYPQLTLGMLAIFVYVGVEVAIVSNLGELLSKPGFGNLQASEVAPYISMYWGSLMIGRWTGSIAAFNLKKSTQTILSVVIPFIAFIVVIAVNSMSGYNMQALYAYVFFIVFQIGGFLFTKNKASLTLGVFAILACAMMILGIFSTGNLAVYAFISGGLFCSIMWPAIFSLSLAGLGKYTTQGSAFLVMMILGGAVIPPIQGKLADFIQAGASVDGYGIHLSYFLPALCFAYLAFFAFYVKKQLNNQGVEGF